VGAIETLHIGSNPDERTISRSALYRIFKRMDSVGCEGLKLLHITSMTFSDKRIVPPHMFAPLAHCTALESFSFFEAIDLGYYLSNEGICEMAKSWKSLRYFSIRGRERPSDGTKPSLSFASIVALLKECPSLKEIRLSVDIDKVGRPTSYQTYDRSRYRLERMHFQASSLVETQDLALWLCDVCPWDGVKRNTYYPPIPCTKAFEEMDLIPESLQWRTHAVEAKWRKKVNSLEAEIEKLRGCRKEEEKYTPLTHSVY
jgi:hypothetical protein